MFKKCESFERWVMSGSTSTRSKLLDWMNWRGKGDHLHWKTPLVNETLNRHFLDNQVGLGHLPPVPLQPRPVTALVGGLWMLLKARPWICVSKNEAHEWRGQNKQKTKEDKAMWEGGRRWQLGPASPGGKETDGSRRTWEASGRRYVAEAVTSKY